MTSDRSCSRAAFSVLAALSVVLALWACFAQPSSAQTQPQKPSDTVSEGYYSPGGWATLHQNPRNSRFVDIEIDKGTEYRTWSALQGASVLTAPTVSPDGRSLYVTTGKGRGQSNLHAFTIDGKPLWSAPPWSDPESGVDPCALLSSPIIDQAGDIYINDCNQIFAFTQDGRLKWKTGLPSSQAGDWQPVDGHAVNAVTTAVFTAQGHYLGVTNFGDVVVHDRATGRRLNPPFRLSGVNSKYADQISLPDSLLNDDLMDEDFREWMWQLVFGGAMRSANTPAVNAKGRVFVVGGGDTPTTGALYGLDVVETDDGIEIIPAFTTKVGVGSGSSPALSADGTRAYVSDENGVVYAVDASNGGVLWTAETGATAAAMAVADDGSIAALQRPPAAALIMLTPDGETAWESDLSDLVKDAPRSLFLGRALAVGNGNPTILRDVVLVPVAYGYKFPFREFIPQTRSALIAVDRKSGKGLFEVVALTDDSSGITAVLPNGVIINTLGAIQSSASAPIAPLFNRLLPRGVSMLPPTGGIQVAIPVEPSKPAQ